MGCFEAESNRINRNNQLSGNDTLHPLHSLNHSPNYYKIKGNLFLMWLCSCCCISSQGTLCPCAVSQTNRQQQQKKKLCSYSVDLVKLAETPAEASVPLATCDPLWPRHFSFEPFGFLNTGKISSFALSQTILTETFMQLTSSTAPIWAAPVVSLFVNSMAIPR